jgi:hypothetical protein
MGVLVGIVKDSFTPSLALPRRETVSQYAQPHRCHAEQSEASRIFSCYKVEILRPRPQNDIATQSLAKGRTFGSEFLNTSYRALLQGQQVPDNSIQFIVRQLHVGHKSPRFDVLRVTHPGLQVFLGVCDNPSAQSLPAH